jgi:hypothetical protein
MLVESYEDTVLVVSIGHLIANPTPVNAKPGK